MGRPFVALRAPTNAVAPLISLQRWKWQAERIPPKRPGEDIRPVSRVQLLSDIPPGEEIQVILDNYYIYKINETRRKCLVSVYAASGQCAQSKGQSGSGFIPARHCGTLLSAQLNGPVFEGLPSFTDPQTLRRFLLQAPSQVQMQLERFNETNCRKSSFICPFAVTRLISI